MKSKSYKRGKRKGQNCGKEQFSRRQRDVESVDMESSSKLPHGGDNDWTWYARTPELVKSYASFPFGVATGNFMQYGQPNMDSYSVPGIMTLYFGPTIGEAENEISPVNVAMRQLYSDVRHKNSGSTNYDAPDLMMYILAMDSPYMYISYLRRLYGVMMNYSVLNRYTPKALVSAMMVDYDDVKEHLPELLGYINQLSAKVAGSLCIPNGMSYMARHTWMVSGIYTDSTTSKAQMYMYVPESYYAFTVTDAGGGAYVSSLTATRFGFPGQTFKTFKQLVEFGDNMVSPLLANEDINIMSGDILKAYGMGGIVSIPQTPDTYQVLPEYNREVLSQFENATIFSTQGYDNVIQDTSIGGGYLKYAGVRTPGFSISTSATLQAADLTLACSVMQTNKLLNFHWENPTPEDVLVATRLTAGIKNVTYDNTTGSIHFEGNYSFGSELCCNALIWYYNGMDNRVLNYEPVYSYVFGQNLYTKYGLLSQFDWHPATMPFYFASGFHSGYVPFVDADMYTFLSYDNLYNLHNIALLQELFAPVGNSTTT